MGCGASSFGAICEHGGFGENTMRFEQWLQFQTFDTFLSVLSPEVRPEISRLLLTAAGKSSNPSSRLRIEKAAMSIANGGRAAEPYNHEEAMRKYQEEFRKSYPQT